ncbi:MAG: hypothetical protein ACJ0A2_05985 [Alphaproteobacteria bacterium]|tara:strand:- start:123 stop:353 length:231 start_codon:yes stop_codon:yes gene_type:complete
MFNGFVLFLGSVGLVLLWNLAMYINPNFNNEIKKESKKIWNFSFGGKLFLIGSSFFVILIFGLAIDFIIRFVLSIF